MIVAFVGRRELGKTTAALYMARKIEYRIILDPRGMFVGGAPWTLLGDALDNAALMSTLLVEHEVVIVPRDVDEQFTRLATFVEYWAQHAPPEARLAVLVDEAGLLSPNLWRDAWGYVLRCIPRKRVFVLITAHRPTEVPPVVRAIADTWCLFRMTHKADIEFIKDQCGETAAAGVQRLHPFEFVSWDDSTATLTTHRDSSTWFVETSRSRDRTPRASLMPQSDELQQEHAGGAAGVWGDL